MVPIKHEPDGARSVTNQLAQLQRGELPSDVNNDEGDSGVLTCEACNREHRTVLHNCPLKGIGVRDFFCGGGSGRFSIGCASKFRAAVAYLEVGSSDLEQIHQKTYFHKIHALFMLYSCFFLYMRVCQIDALCFINKTGLTIRWWTFSVASPW